MPLRKKLGCLFFPVSIVYGIIIKIRNWLFNHGFLKEVSFKIPIISIGNITVGGTGKTPHVEYIAELLSREFNIAILSRGYKRKTTGFLTATSKSLINDIGDEPKQIKQKFPNVTVAVSEKRIDGVKELLKNNSSLNAIILDDAFQHRYIKPGLSVLLIDYNRPLTNDYYLPFGDLRENKHESKRAQIIIVTKTPEGINPIEKTLFKKEIRLYPYQQLFFTSLAYDDPKSVFKKNTKKISLKDLKGSAFSILLVTGIANPEPLYKFLSSFTNSVEKIYFPDHHQYTHNDLNTISDHFENIKKQEKIIITTEKDAVRFRELNNVPKSIIQSIYYIPVKISFLDGGEKFNKIIKDYVRKHNSR